MFNRMFRLGVAILFLIPSALFARQRAVCPAGGCTNARPAPAIASFGAVDFTPDTARAVTFRAFADRDTRATATAADGTQWTLTVPQGALMRTIDITITPMASVHASGATAVVPDSGVVLSPDGTEFTRPATLTVSSGASKQIFVAAQDGTNLQLALTPNGARSVALIGHFSSAVSAPPLSPDQAAAAYAAAMAAARQFLASAKGQANPYPPDVPDFDPADCSVNDFAKHLATDAWAKKMSSPEAGYINAVLAASRATDGSITPEDADVLKSLLARVIQRSEQAMTDASKLPNHGIGCADTLIGYTLGMLRLQRFLGFDDSTAEVFAIAAPWLDSIVKDYLGRLKNEHDFTAIREVLSITHDMALIGMGTSAAQQLAAALHFRMHISMTADSQAPQQLHLEAAGDVDVAPDANMNLVGSSTINYVSGQGVDPTGSTATLLAQGFDEQVLYFRLNPCAITAEFDLTTLNSPEEKWNICKAGECTEQDFAAMDPFAQGYADLFHLFFEDGYNFAVGMFNKRATVVDDTVDRSKNLGQFGNFTEHIHFTVQHTPQ